MKRAVLPLVLTLCFISESLFVELFPIEAFDGQRIIVPRFLLVLLSLMGIYYIRNKTIIYGALFGFLFDVYYTGVIGVYMSLFPLAVYFTAKLIKIIQVNLVTAGLIALLNITVVEVLVFGLNKLILHVHMSPLEFADLRLWPTLVLNLAFFILICYPTRNWLMRRKKEELDE